MIKKTIVTIKKTGKQIYVLPAEAKAGINSGIYVDPKAKQEKKTTEAKEKKQPGETKEKKQSGETK